MNALHGAGCQPGAARSISWKTTDEAGGQDVAGAVLLTNAEIRRYVRRLVETEHPDLPALSYQELAPEAQIRPVGRISLS
jgi:type III secretory pathway component EscV